MTKEFKKLNKDVEKKGEEYSQLSDIDHVLERAGLYIGCLEPISKDTFMYKDGKITKQEYTFSEALLHIFKEALANASDNMIFSREKGVDPGIIEVIMDDNMISMKNYGVPISLDKKRVINLETGEEGETLYIPDIIFGKFNSGSNYSKTRIRKNVGCNGVGSKALNIFSKKFKVIIFNSISQLHYTQEWENNMKKRKEPIITKYTGDVSSVEVIYYADFPRFSTEYYTPELKMIFANELAQISFTNKCKVYFNSEEIDFSDILKYSKSIFPYDFENYILHYEWDSSIKEEDIKTRKDGSQYCENSLPKIELCVIDASNCGGSMSFANCMETRDGGVHVDSSIRAISSEIVERINSSFEKKKKSVKLTIADVRPHIFVIVSVNCENPSYESQTKTKLKTPAIKINLPNSLCKKVEKWKLVDMLHNIIESKELNSLKKTDGKARKCISLEEGSSDAKFAGDYKNGKNLECTLIICEGQSALAYVRALVPYLKGGNDYYGYTTIRGKSLNVMNASRFQIENNKEITNIKKMFALQEGVDYTEDENYKKLRYGKLLVMADADVDGIHITGLMLNIFYCRFKGLISRDFFTSYLIPIIKISKGSEIIERFYTEYQYKTWITNNDIPKGCEVNYFKGLSSSGNSNIEDDVKNIRFITFKDDEKTDEFMRLAFDKEQSNKRKQWLRKYNSDCDFQMESDITISDFIANRLVLYSIANIERSIPSFVDGFKNGQRKLFYGCQKIFSKSKKALKVSQIVGQVSSSTCYHHGPTSLEKTFFGMTWSFPGSNNIPIFSDKDGQFGSYVSGGKDMPAGRYPASSINTIVDKIFRKEDEPILEYNEEEGQKIEPKHYYPIIPMTLVNGVLSISTAWSSRIFQYSPLQIIDYLLILIDNDIYNKKDDLIEIEPWCNKFEGKLYIAKDKKKVFDEDGEEEIPDEDDVDSNKCIFSEGVMEVKKGEIIIHELPVGKNGSRFMKYLEELKEKKMIKDYKNYDLLNNRYRFVIHPKKDGEITYSMLGMKKKISLRNMWLLGDNYIPNKYDSQYEIIDKFYDMRVSVYETRKQYEIKKIQDKIDDLNYRHKYITEYKKGNITVMDVEPEVTYKQLDDLEIPKKYYKEIKLHELSKYDERMFPEKMNKLLDEKKKMEDKKSIETWKDELEELRKAIVKYYGFK